LVLLDRLLPGADGIALMERVPELTDLPVIYPSGTIGAWGYNRTEGELVSPHRADLMSYCGGQWISDYHFSNAVRHRTYTEKHRHLRPNNPLAPRVGRKRGPRE